MHLYLVTYDICDPKRLRKVYRLMRGYGEHLQYSVFLCSLNSVRRTVLESRLEAIMNLRADQVLFVDIGPENGRTRSHLSTLGKAYICEARRATIV
jgi:CRISPR-associated protein Cas2